MMASITPYRRKSDNRLISFHITVSNGKHGKRYTTTYPEHGTIPESWSETKARREAKHFAEVFEEQCKAGNLSTDNPYFADYAERVLERKVINGCKPKTICTYRQFLPVINAHFGRIRVKDIKPAHLNDLYRKLSLTGSGFSRERATVKLDIKKWLKDHKLSQEAFAKLAGVGHSTVGAAANNKAISAENAEKIAAAIGRSAKECFRFEKASKQGLAPKTVLEYHRLISTILKAATNEGIILYNPAERAELPKLPKGEAECFELDEVREILAVAENEPLKWRVCLQLLIFTGMRRGELAGLQWSRVDWKKGTLLLCENRVYIPHKGVISTTLKTGESRKIKISAELLSLLRQWRKEQFAFLNNIGATPSGYILTGEKGQPISPDGVSGWLRKFAKRNAIQSVRAHKFRHTHASMLISSNSVDIVTISKRLGHSKTSTTTDIYAHLLEKTDETACAVLDDMIYQRKA